MAAQLAHSANAAREAERLSWIAAVGILLLSLLVSALIARSISEPLNRLAEGTREVAAGQFDYRLDARGGDEFAQVAQDFNTMIERLGELDQMKRDFVSKVSHDLKTPLTSMQETISAILDEVPGPITEKQRTLLLINQQSGQRLSTMLAKLLDLSRLEAGIEPHIQVIDGSELIQRAVLHTDSARAERKLRINVDLPAEPVLFEGDIDRMLQLLDNLLENAIKFSPSNDTIRLEMHAFLHRPASIPEDRWIATQTRSAQSCTVQISVADHGPGIPDDQKERIFERFYQTPSGRAVRGRGVGLGLTIAREIVMAHSGKIWVTDNADGGSVFNVLLPGTFCVSDDERIVETIPGSISTDMPV
jgi:two-component system sensor histidine kinase GlrK